MITKTNSQPSIIEWVAFSAKVWLYNPTCSSFIKITCNEATRRKLMNNCAGNLLSTTWKNIIKWIKLSFHVLAFEIGIFRLWWCWLIVKGFRFDFQVEMMKRMERMCFVKVYLYTLFKGRNSFLKVGTVYDKRRTYKTHATISKKCIWQRICWPISSIRVN